MNIDAFMILDTKLWEAIKNNDRDGFLELVDEDAVILCDGYRYSGKEYADMISNFDCRSFVIDYYEIVNEDAESVQVYYQITNEVNDIRKLDLAGTFNITVTWTRKLDGWVAIFLMNQRMISE
ncbi:MAG: nuclear transport factor 2 family protein [Erysipelotrichaceae bacterium]|nr:nuclear transport factor 2 family protein [Erysipelotrichaceae bacterium]